MLQNFIRMTVEKVVTELVSDREALEPAAGDVRGVEDAYPVISEDDARTFANDGLRRLRSKCPIAAACSPDFCASSAWLSSRTSRAAISRSPNRSSSDAILDLRYLHHYIYGIVGITAPPKWRSFLPANPTFS